MDPEIKKFIDDTDSLRLSSEEQSALGSEMKNFLDSHPQSSVSPWYSWLFVRHGIPLALACIVLLCGGVSLAAEQALPGSFLYPVKIDVNEQALQVLSFNQQAKIDTQISLADRRLNEIQTLLAKNDATPSNIDEATQNLEQHTDYVQQAAAESLKNGDVSQSLDTAVSLSAVLDAHDDVLDQASDTPAEKALTDQVQDSIDDDQQQLNTLIASTSSDIASTTATSTPAASQSGQDLADDTDSTHDDVVSILADIKSNDKADPDTISSIETLIGTGDSQRASGDISGAFLTYEEADKTAKEYQIYLQLNASLDTPVPDDQTVQPLVDPSSGGDSSSNVDSGSADSSGSSGGTH